MSGAHFLAETLKGYGVTHYFFMPVSVPEAMPEFDRVGIAPIMAHSEKDTAYIADAYSRVSRRVGVCGAQLVGKHRCETKLPLADGLVRHLEAALEQQLGDIAEAELVAQPPQHRQEHAVGRVLEFVERRAGSLVETTSA